MCVANYLELDFGSPNADKWDSVIRLNLNFLKVLPINFNQNISDIQNEVMSADTGGNPFVSTIDDSNGS
jgi:hypothetical protein